MVGIGETYLPAFVLALTASQLASGLIATVPMLAGAVLQLASPYVLRRIGSYRRWVVVCAVAQAGSFVPLVVAAATGRMPTALLFAIAAVYWGAGLATGPAWNVWVESLVPASIRARFFARRARVGQLGLLLGFVAGGVILQASTTLGAPLAAFGVLFSVALLSRLASAHYLHVQREPSPPGDELGQLGIGRLLKVARSDTRARLLFYMLGIQMASWVAGPYFTPYMLVQLEFSYSAFVGLTCAAFLAKIAVLPMLGRVAERFGARRLLWIGGALVVPVPALWLLHHGFAYLLVLQLVSGAAWGAYELAILLLLLEAIPRAKRLGVLTVFNVANGAAIAGGSLVGGALLAAFGSTAEAYATLFALSTIARAAPLVLLVKLPKDSLRRMLLATRPIALRPSVGALERPVLASLEAETAPSAESEEPLASVPREVDHQPALREPAAATRGPTVPA